MHGAQIGSLDKCILCIRLIGATWVFFSAAFVSRTDLFVKEKDGKSYILEQTYKIKQQAIPENDKTFNDWEIWEIEDYKQHLLLTNQ